MFILHKQRLILVGIAFLSLGTQLNGQVPTSRAAEIRQRRIDKQARLWPEHTSGIVRRLNKLEETGLFEGAQSGEGKNGYQFVLGGMRSGNGTTFGVGYRRVDLWEERIGLHTTARGTFQGAYMFDLDVNFHRLNTQRGEMRVYAKYEYSPLMDFYGEGPNSQKGDRSSYRLDDTGIDLMGRYRIWKKLYAGGSGGLYFPSTGPGKRSGYPTVEEEFPPTETPGIGEQLNMVRVSATLQYDYRDLATGPRRGGNYYGIFTRYWDQSLGLYTFNRLAAAVEQYIPYANMTRVIALRLGAIATWTQDGQTVPFYLQPTLGGNEYLRGFASYRFTDQNSILAIAEHRWHLFSGGYAAAFFEMGKVASKGTQLNFGNSQYSGGIGFNFTLRNAVIMRIDNAVSHEGYRFIWTFSKAW